MQAEYIKLNDNVNEMITENSNLMKKLNQKDSDNENKANTGYNTILGKFGNELKLLNIYSRDIVEKYKL